MSQENNLNELDEALAKTSRVFWNFRNPDKDNYKTSIEGVVVDIDIRVKEYKGQISYEMFNFDVVKDGVQYLKGTPDVTRPRKEVLIALADENGEEYIFSTGLSSRPIKRIKEILGDTSAQWMGKYMKIEALGKEQLPTGVQMWTFAISGDDTPKVDAENPWTTEDSHTSKAAK
jgi:hypothetical protein